MDADGRKARSSNQAVVEGSTEGESMSEQRLCKNCKHYNDFALYCVRGKHQVGVDPVDGRPVYKYKVCDSASMERESWWPWSCGKSGRYFEKKGAA